MESSRLINKRGWVGCGFRGDASPAVAGLEPRRGAPGLRGVEVTRSKIWCRGFGRVTSAAGAGTSGRGDVQRVRRGEQITALRILKWRGDASGINTSRENLEY